MSGSHVTVSCSRERIYVGQDFALESLRTLIPSGCEFVGVVSDRSVGELYGGRVVEAARQSGRRAELLLLPDGEPSKHRFWKQRIEDWLLESRASKQSCLVALGGGVVGDLTGFVAATYLRGIPVLQMPTSLLAMVDSSVGGKTAIDVPAGKNLVGAFHHPHAVIIDVRFLETLPMRHLHNGMAEVVKVAVALDGEFFGWLERADVAQRVLDRDLATLLQVALKSVTLKALVIDQDERDKGRRNILNAGHTVGHALEALLFPRWLHGECVAVGLVVEAYAALDAGVLASGAAVERLRRCLRQYHLPAEVPHAELTAPDALDSLIRFAMVDKKTSGGGEIPCVLLKSVGVVGDAITYAVDEAHLRALLSMALEVRTRGNPQVSAMGQQQGAIVVRAPGSKSASNRVLLMAGLASGTTVLRGVLHAADTYVMLDALAQLGVKWEWNSAGDELIMHGSGGKLTAGPSGETHLFLENAGTASRFLTACATWLPHGHSAVLSGVPRLHERPIAQLVDALRGCGATVDYLERDGCFPVRVHGQDGLPPNAVISLDASLSSQFTTAVLLASVRKGAQIHLQGDLVSQPYVRMTTELMRRWGAVVTSSADGRQHTVTASGCYVNAASGEVEADASTATYPLAWAAVTGATVEVANMGSASLQGDAAFALLLGRMGCKVEQTAETTRVTGAGSLLTALGEVDMDHLTDAFMTMAAVAAVAKGRTRIVGIANQRVKECDRIAATVAGLRACGVEATELPDGIEIVGRTFEDPSNLARALIPCHKDHRIAMSFAVLGCVRPGVVLLDKGCVEKTFPHFWHMMRVQFGVDLVAAPEREKGFPKGFGGGNHLAPGGKKILVRRDEKSLLLIGMRGAGKSTLGCQLAVHLGGWKFVDADAAFLEQEGIGPTEYASSKGVEAFRAVEATLLRLLIQNNPQRTVISCGGGIVETEAGRAAVSESNLLVAHVRREWKALEAQLTLDGGGRVPLNESLSVTWQRRLQHYERLSQLELWLEGADAIERATRAVRSRLVVTAAPRWRLGPGTTFVSWTLDTYIGVNELAADGADAVEFRADLLSNCSEESVRLELAQVRRFAAGLPVVFTVRSKQQGGRWTGSGAEYLRLLELGAKSGCEIIDVEACWASSIPGLRQWIEEYHSHGVHFIFSEHQMQTPPTLYLLVDLAQMCRSLAPNVPAIIKIVLASFSIDHNDVLFQFRTLLSTALVSLAHPESAGFILLLVGSRGRLSRLSSTFLTPCAHSQMAVAAPGQITVPELTDLRNRLGYFDPPGRLCLFGKPISASPSPAIHNAALAAARCNNALEYDLCETDSLDILLKATQDPAWVGGNVTMPLKESVFKSLDPSLCSSAALMIGAVNTIWKTQDGRLGGDNTDWRAIYELTRPHFPEKGVVCILGAGGTAKAALYSAQRLGASQICIVNRSKDRAEALLKSGSEPGPRITVHADVTSVPSFHLLISCIPGTVEVTLPADLSQLRCVLDVAYQPRETCVLKQVRASAPTAVLVEGWEMLLEQAAWGWQRWLGRMNAPRDAMRNAIQKVL